MRRLNKKPGQMGATTENAHEPRSRSVLAVALRFTCCAIPGLVILFVCSFQLFVRYYDPAASDVNVHPLLLGTGVLVGGLLMLIGVGRWKQWAYLLVFVAIPLSLYLYIMIDPKGRGGSLSLAAFVGICAFLTLQGVRAFYRWWNKPIRNEGRRRPDDSEN